MMLIASAIIACSPDLSDSPYEQERRAKRAAEKKLFQDAADAVTKAAEADKLREQAGAIARGMAQDLAYALKNDAGIDATCTAAQINSYTYLGCSDIHDVKMLWYLDDAHPYAVGEAAKRATTKVGGSWLRLPQGLPTEVDESAVRARYPW